MDIIEITKDNIDSEHICCAIGNDRENASRADGKKAWLKERYNDGLVFKRFNERGKLFVEYMPIEKVWKPVIGKNYIVINCLWVAGRFQQKGLGKKLLEECINDAKKQGKDGVCVVTSEKKMGFLTDKTFFVKYGFETCDKAYPYFELLSLKLNKNAKAPVFTDNAKEGVFGSKKDVSFVYSNQCPFTEEYSKIMSDVAEKYGLKTEIIKLTDYSKAQKLGSPFGTFGIYYKGKFVHHELMPEKKFIRFLDKVTRGK